MAWPRRWKEKLLSDPRAPVGFPFCCGTPRRSLHQPAFLLGVARRTQVDGRGAKEFLTATRSQYNVAEDAKRDDLAELIACLGACLGRVASSGSTAPRTKRDPKPAARPPTANGWALLKRFESQTDSGFYVPRQPVAWLAVTVLHPDGYSKGGSKGFAPAILQHYAYRKRNDWIGKMEKNKGPNKQRKAFEAW